MRKRFLQKYRILRWVLLLPILCLCGAMFLSQYKPDWIFLFKETVLDRAETVSRREIIPQSKEYEALSLGLVPLEEIRRNSKYGYNQSLFLINEEFPLPEDADWKLVLYRDTQLSMTKETADAFAGLADTVFQKYGQKLLITSSYRTAEEQKELFRDDPVLAAQPGNSEHQTGLALDVALPYYGGAAILKTEAGQYVYRSCWENGFIIRYPYGQASATGIPFEPWHLRYVGYPHAEIIRKNRMTLEEYIVWLEPGRVYQMAGYLVSRQQAENGAILLPELCGGITVSSDNTGYFIWSLPLPSA